MNKLFAVIFLLSYVTFSMANGSNQDTNSFGISTNRYFKRSVTKGNSSNPLALPENKFSGIRKLTRLEQFESQLHRVEREFNIQKANMARGSLFRLKSEANKFYEYLQEPNTPQIEFNQGSQLLMRTAQLIVQATKMDLMVPRAVSLSLTQAKNLPIDTMFHKRFGTLKRLMKQVQNGTCSPKMLGAVNFWTEQLKLDLKTLPNLSGHDKNELQLLLEKAEELNVIADCTAITITPSVDNSQQ